MTTLFRRNLPVILMLLLEILVGVLLLINPEAFTQAVFIAFGVFCLVVGIIYLIKYLRANRKGEAKFLMLIWACFLMVFGLFAVVSYPMLITFFEVIVILYAVMMSVAGVVKIVCFVNARANSEPASWLIIAGAVVSIALGGVVIVNPFESTHVLFLFTGVCILISAAVDLIALIRGVYLARHAVNDGLAEVTVMNREDV